MSQSFLRALTLQCQHCPMQNIVAASGTAENLRIQRLSRRHLGASPPRGDAILAQAARNLTIRICAAAALTAFISYAAATDIRGQYNVRARDSAEDNAKGNSQADAIERDIKISPGREVRFGICTSIRSDCSSGPLPSVRLAVSPQHGAITVRRAMLKATNLKQCLAVEVPALVALYRAAQNFDGVDRFELEIGFSDGRKQLQRFKVTVANAPADGRRI